MSQAAQLAERIVVCHREPGYLRLQLPAELCTTDLAADLEAGMKTQAGIGVLLWTSVGSASLSATMPRH